jgi:uncharacterized protein YjdB
MTRFPITRYLIVTILSFSVLVAGIVWPVAVTPTRAQSATTSNPIDDSTFFVRQHYRDFLNREPDTAGLNFWVNEIESCGSDSQCREIKRINVSAAFFLSIEFQESGYLSYRTRKAAYGNIPGSPVPVIRRDLVNDAQLISHNVIVGAADWQTQLETNKRNYFDLFVNRQRFTALYPSSLTPASFIDLLNTNSGNVLTTSERNSLISDLTSGAKTRAQALRSIAENAELNRREFNRAFVLMQYLGYLRRNADDTPDLNFSGLQFWLTKLDQFGGNFVNAEMVKAFITSDEYRGRFDSAKSTLYINPTDPLLSKKRTAAGDVISYYGTRDAAGMATSIDSLKANGVDGAVNTYLLDSQGRFTEIDAANGVSLNLAWQSANSAMVTVRVAGDDPIEITVPLTFNASNQAQSFNSLAGNGVSETATSNVATARVARCNGAEPADDAIVDVEVVGFLGGDTLRMKSVGNGIYQVAVPSSAANPISNLSDLNDSINQKAEDICHTLDTLDMISPEARSAVAQSIDAGVAKALALVGASALRIVAVAAVIDVAIASALGAVALLALCNNPIGLLSDAVDRMNGATGITLRPVAVLDGVSLVGTPLDMQPPTGPFSGTMKVDFPQCTDHVEISPSSATVDIGSTTLFTAKVKDQQNHDLSIPIGRLSWTSSNLGIATIDSVGLAKGIAAGSAQITVKEIRSNKSANASLKVGDEIAGIYTGTNSGTAGGCSDPDDNGGFSFATVVEVNQPVITNGARTISGKITVKSDIGDLVLSFQATVTNPAATRTITSGTLTVIAPSGVSGSGTFSGQWVRGSNGTPDRLTINYLASGVAFGSGCAVSGTVVSTR